MSCGCCHHHLHSKWMLVKGICHYWMSALSTAPLLARLKACQNASCLWLTYLMNTSTVPHLCCMAFLIANKHFFFIVQYTVL